MEQTDVWATCSSLNSIVLYNKKLVTDVKGKNETAKKGNRSARGKYYKQTMPKYQEKSSMTLKTSKVAPQANCSLPEMPRLSRTGIT